MKWLILAKFLGSNFNPALSTHAIFSAPCRSSIGGFYGGAHCAVRGHIYFESSRSLRHGLHRCLLLRAAASERGNLPTNHTAIFAAGVDELPIL
jgi:hypothetical protein